MAEEGEAHAEEVLDFLGARFQMDADKSQRRRFDHVCDP